jgi:hypothetical protein
MVRIVVAAVVSFWMMVVGSSLAAAAAPRVAIEGFRGPQAERIQGAVETGLLGRYYLVPDFSVEEAARANGVGLLVDDEFARVGKALDVRAFLSAEIARHRQSGWQVRLLVRRGDTGAPIGRILVADRRLDRLERELARRTSRRLETLFARAPASAALEPASLTATAGDAADAEVVEADADSVAPAATRAAAGPRLLEVAVDARMFSRSFSYAQNLTGLPEYEIAGALATVMEVALHPLASLGSALAPVGLLASLEYGLGVGSRVSESEERRASDVHGYSVGMEYRLQHAGFELAPQAGYAVRAFTTGEPGAQSPDVSYSLLSGGLAARAPLTARLGAMARCSYLHVLDAGPLTAEERFSRASVRGMELEGGLAFSVLRELEIRASVGLRRFGYDMNAQPGDSWVAGGAVDRTVWGGIGLAYHPGETSRAVSARAKPATPAGPPSRVLAARR